MEPTYNDLKKLIAKHNNVKYICCICDGEFVRDDVYIVYDGMSLKHDGYACKHCIKSNVTKR